MTTNLDDILNQKANAMADEAPEPEAETPPEPEAETAETYAEEGEDEGAEAQPAEEPETPKGPEPEPEKAEDKPEPPQPSIPKRRFDEVLEQKRALEAEIAKLRQGEQPKPEVPDVFADPEAYTRHVTAIAEQQARNHALNLSEYAARKEHGAERVDEAFEAFQSAPAAERYQVMNSPSPWQEMVAWHEKRRALEDIGDPADFRKRVEAEVRAQLQSEMATQQVRAEKPAPAPSLAEETSVGDRGGQWSGPADLSRILGR